MYSKELKLAAIEKDLTLNVPLAQLCRDVQK